MIGKLSIAAALVYTVTAAAGAESFALGNEARHLSHAEDF